MFALKENETILQTVRKHWFVLFGEIAGLTGIYVLPFILYAFLKNANLPLDTLKNFSLLENGAVVLFAGALWTLCIWMKAAAIWTDYYLDIWVITNDRVIDIEQIGFFHRETSTFPIERVQDVTIRIHGLIATLLDFGEVHVQTAGAAREFVIRGVGKPRHIKERILAEHSRVRRSPSSSPLRENGGV